MTKTGVIVLRSTGVVIAGIVVAIGVHWGLPKVAGKHRAKSRPAMRPASTRTTSTNTKTAVASPKRPSTNVRVGLLRLRAAATWRDTVKNDILIEKTVAEIGETLIVLVVGRDKHEATQYSSELYNLCWDAACLHKRPQLNVRILSSVANEATRVWEDLLLLSGLGAVFGEEDAVNLDRVNAQRMMQDGLREVTYRSLAIFTKRYLRPQYRFFEDERVDLRERSVVLIGGTFDHLHNGHKKLLSLALSICHDLLIVGITGEDMLKNKKYAHLIESQAQRQHSVEEFVAFVKPSVRVEFTVLSDPYGPALTVPGPAAIVMSTETLLAAETINSMRSRNNLVPLDVYVCRRTDASTLSSSFIRQHIDQESQRK